MKNNSTIHNPNPLNKRRLWNGLTGVVIESGAVVVLMLVALALIAVLKVYY
jgi:hypothetical protein